jgi:hypothetical protein
MPKKPLRLGDLLRRLKKFGVVPLERRGKGSELVLLMPEAEGAKKGELITIKNHGKRTEIYIPVILSILRRFNIDQDDFWT